MNDIMMSNSNDLGANSVAQESNSEDDLFFSSPTMKKMLEVMVIQTFNRFLKPNLERMMRDVVRREVELIEKKFLLTKGNPEKDIQPPKPRSLKLKFLTNVSDPVLTGVEIKGVGGNAIELALVDDNTGEIVESGPEASAKVEIVVLRGEFGDDNGGNWTVEEFCGNIVREREGKKSLLAETVHVRLNKGIGSIDKIKFTHSSIYMKTGMFRLGARIVDNFNNIQVKEARTESFTVKDGRQLYHEKHDPPSLSDGVQRLKNIGKCSNYRLRNESVHTVEDFLILLLKDSEQLKRVNSEKLLTDSVSSPISLIDVVNLILALGLSTKINSVLNLKPKMLDETISQARRCIINERIFSYIDLQEKEGVVFNIVGEVKGLILGVQYLPTHLLSESDKANAQRLLVSACEHWDHVKQYDNETSLMQYLSQIVPTENPSNSPSGEVPSTSDSVENFRTSDEHCSTSFQHNVSAVIPARGASAISLNDPSSASINNLEFSYSPIYSPSFHDLWIDPCFENLLFGLNAHQPHDDSASKVNVHNRWKTLLKIFKRRRAAALTDSQPPKKQRVF